MDFQSTDDVKAQSELNGDSNASEVNNGDEVTKGDSYGDNSSSDVKQRDGTDANDYSRFENLHDSDDESPGDKQKDEAEKAMSYEEAFFLCSMLKDNGNSSFKSGGMLEAEKHYTDAINTIDKFKDDKPPKITEKQFSDKRDMLVSLHGNLAMVYLKQDKLKETIENCNSVLNYDKDNVKALYRRGAARSKLVPPQLDEAKDDLNNCIRLDPTNAPAKKELSDVLAKLKQAQQKQKDLFSNMFTKGSGFYEDKEKERLKKIRDEENEKARLEDEWRKSNIERRSQRLEEQTFDAWKKEKDDIRELEKKEKEAPSKPPAPAAPIPTKERKPKESSSTIEYDEEEAKIIAETASKGYCYFKKQPSSDDAALIGDIRPTTIKSSVSLDSAPNTSGGGVAASSWNHAGTWEEKNTTSLVKSKIRSLFEGRHFKGENFEVAVSSVKEPEGEANIIFSKGKKKHGFDMSLSMDVDFFLNAAEASGSISNGNNGSDVDNNADEDVAMETTSNNSRKKYKATIKLTEMNITNQFDWDISYKNSKSIDATSSGQLKNVVGSFRSDVKAALQAFIDEYSNM